MVGPDFIETKLHHVISRQKQSIRRNDKARAEAGATPFPVRPWYSSNILTVLVLTSDQVKLTPLASSWSALG